MAENTATDPAKKDGPAKKPLGVLLKEKGLLTESHIQYALQEQKITKEMLGELFERLGFVTEHDVVPTDLGEGRIDQHDDSVVFGGAPDINSSGDVAFHATLTPADNNQIEWGTGMFIAYADDAVAVQLATVGPSLGEDAVRNGTRAILLASVLVLVFVAFYYLFAGLVAMNFFEPVAGLPDSTRAT